MPGEARNRWYYHALQDWSQRRLVDQREERIDEAWSIDYTSTEAFEASVVDRREQWRRLLAPPLLTASGDAEVAAHPDVDGGLWIDVPIDGELTASGLLVVPPGASRLVVFQHGLGSTPERVFGAADSAEGAYRGVGRRLVEAGYAVLAPMNLITVDLRNRAQDIARLAGTTVEGIELSRLRLLLDALGDVARAERGETIRTDAVAMTGMSWGGMAAQFWTPLEPRLAVAASLGFFNDRARKMLVQDSRYVTFADTDEHHAFLRGHLLGFSDSELAALTCPRPFLVQHGRFDAIGWAPQIRAEFTRAQRHWELLKLDDLVEYQEHSGGHEIDPDGLVQWLQRVFPAKSS